MEEGGMAAGKSTAAAHSAWILFEDEASQSLRPPRARTWGRVGCTPVVSVRGRVSMAGMACFFLNIIWSLAAGRKAADNYWGEGATTLEWTLSSPPPFHQFSTLPKIN